MDKCKYCGQLIPDIESITMIGTLEDSCYVWAADFKIFMRKYVPDGELWLIENSHNRIHKIINIGDDDAEAEEGRV